jgi:HAD superfamily hydrolase (TIGR01509 family)
MDGTLTDSMYVWIGVSRQWLAQQGITAPESLDNEVPKMTMNQSAEYVIKLYGLRQSVKEVTGAWKEMVLQRYKNEVTLKPGVGALLRAFKAQGIKMAVATSSFPEGCEAALSRCGILQYFSALVYSDDINVDKTHPDIYLEAARRINVPPQKCLVFEDLYVAVSGAHKAGMAIAAVYDKSGKAHWKEFKQQADYTFRSLEKFPLDADFLMRRR